MQRVEEEIVKRTPKIEKGIIERLRSERSDELSEAESRHNREQVELINDLKQREIKHIDNINRLEKVNSYNQNFKIICHFSLKTSFFEGSNRGALSRPLQTRYSPKLFLRV